ncbi:DUF302 domain-containing protein [Noviherbaspirillum saxi]|uniref:DUF302 domain-containing protein n=1 Tax=Noviherbaspirillum saxi TaxID=2320863 RepID=A0A3A3FEW1_9BURK|nr:DUF302 domain-containing protein [Noviherbaspirillum saxi]RJF91780.1 DUF302 domain-containing protein [Noviherbaspirillum saxi]
MIKTEPARLLILVSLCVALSACGSLHALLNTDEGAYSEAMAIWDRYVDSGGDIAAATTWERKVEKGVTAKEIEEAFASVAAEDNLKMVGESALSAELEARTGQPQKLLKVYSYCNPVTARAMVDFSPHMAAYLPCRIAVVEKEDGLWLYALNMDMLIKLGRQLPPELKKSVLQMRDSIKKMIDKGARGDF